MLSFQLGLKIAPSIYQYIKFNAAKFSKIPVKAKSPSQETQVQGGRKVFAHVARIPRKRNAISIKGEVDVAR